MKCSIFLPVVFASAVSFTACNKKEVTQQPEEQSGAPAAVVAVEEEVVPLVLETSTESLSELAQVAGFAQYMPKDTTAFWTFYDGAGLAKKLFDSPMGTFISSLIEEEQGVSFEEWLNEPWLKGFGEVTGEELFIAFGEGSEKQFGNFMKFSNKTNYLQIKAMVKQLSAKLSDADTSGDIEDAMWREWMQSKEALALFASAQCSPVSMGFKVSDAEKRTEYVETLQSYPNTVLAYMGEFGTCFETSEKGEFKGLTLVGKKLVALIEKEGKEEMVENLGEETYQKLIQIIAEKNLVMMAGQHEEYVVLFFGSQLDALQFATTPSDSILAHEDLKFAHQLAAKELASITFMNDAFVETMLNYSTTFKALALGVLDGIKESSVFGDTRILEALLEDLIEQEKALYNTYDAGAWLTAAYLENGFKIDSVYGGNYPEFDLQAKRRFSEVKEGDGVLLSWSGVSNPVYVELALEYLDAIGSTTYQVLNQMDGLKLENSEFDEFLQGFTLFDKSFKQDALALWGALRKDLNEGLGAESALVVDINGELPTLPMLEEALIKEVKIPRIGYLSTVTDRAKLAASWDTTNSAAERLLKQGSEVFGMAIPMQRPFKSQNNAFTSWSFQIPFTHQNCMPHVTLSDDLFIVGTSIDYATALGEKLPKEPQGKPMAEFHFNFEVLQTLGKNWMAAIDKHGEAVLGDEVAEYNEAKPYLEKLLKASENLQSLEVQTQQRGEKVYNQIHFKVK